MTAEEIEARFAALDTKIAAVDGALARCAQKGCRHTLPAALPWTMSADGSTWRVELPDGRTAVIERLDDEHTCPCGHHAAEHSNIESGECLAGGCGCLMLAELGPSFLPKVYESRTDFAVGPVCAGVLPAANWCTGHVA